MRWLADFVYPRLCLHCQERISQPGLLCQECGELLELLDPEGRCPKCFRPKAGPICHTCHRTSLPWQAFAAAVARWGPAQAICHCHPPPIDGMASFMVAQYLQQDWPAPDLLMAIPSPPWKWLSGPPLEHQLLRRIARMLGTKASSYYTPVKGKHVLLIHHRFTDERLRHWGTELILKKAKRLSLLTFC